MVQDSWTITRYLSMGTYTCARRGYALTFLKVTTKVDSNNKQSTVEWPPKHVNFKAVRVLREQYCQTQNLSNCKNRQSLTFHPESQ